MHSIQPITPRQAEALILELDAYLCCIYPPEDNHLDGISVLEQSGAKMLGAYLEGELVGCAALKFHADYAEVKRVFVKPEFRGRGLSRALMSSLHALALEHGQNTLRLETGDKQLEALGLYQTLGYGRIEPFGEYRCTPQSICMEKVL